MAHVKVSIGKGSDNNPGRAKAKKTSIVLFDWNEVANIDDVKRGADGITYTVAPVFISGYHAITIYGTPDTIKCYDGSEGDTDKAGFIHHVEFEHPNTEDKVYASFVENCINGSFGAIVTNFESGVKRLAGTPAIPLRFTHEATDDKEQDTNMVKLDSVMRGPKLGFYEASLPVLDTDASGSGA
jgi:hypothetical protein